MRANPQIIERIGEFPQVESLATRPGILRRFLCSLHGGHDWFRVFEPNRLYLKCGDCGHETVGISLR